MPLHSNANPEPPRVFDVTPKTSEKQLAATVATLAHEGEKVLPQGGGVYVGKGLPPVPLKLAKKIRSGDYIEMEELLPEVGNLEDDIPGEPKRRCSRRVYDIFTWLQCFGVYVSIRGAQAPEVIPELMAYMTTIIRVNREYSGTEWRSYDTLFRKHAALRRDTNWSVINPTIYARCFTAATRNPPRCKLCLAISHDTKDCSQQDITDYSLEGRLKSMEQTMWALAPAHPQTPVKSSGEVCRKWNRGECNYPYCRHTHVCSSCGGAHPVIRCPRHGRGGPGAIPPGGIRPSRTGY